MLRKRDQKDNETSNDDSLMREARETVAYWPSSSKLSANKIPHLETPRLPTIDLSRLPSQSIGPKDEGERKWFIKLCNKLRAMDKEESDKEIAQIKKIEDENCQATIAEMNEMRDASYKQALVEVNVLQKELDTCRLSALQREAATRELRTQLRNIKSVSQKSSRSQSPRSSTQVASFR